MAHRTDLSVMVPPVVRAPRVATWLGWGVSRLVHVAPQPQRDASAAALARPVHSWLARASRAVWGALEAQGQRRAAVHLQAMAQTWDSIDPEIAQRLREAATFSASTSRAMPTPAAHNDRSV
jgi:hypothetical protein